MINQDNYKAMLRREARNLEEEARKLAEEGNNPAKEIALLGKAVGLRTALELFIIMEEE